LHAGEACHGSRVQAPGWHTSGSHISLTIEIQNSGFRVKFVKHFFESNFDLPITESDCITAVLAEIGALTMRGVKALLINRRSRVCAGGSRRTIYRSVICCSAATSGSTNFGSWATNRLSRNIGIATDNPGLTLLVPLERGLTTKLAVQRVGLGDEAFQWHAEDFMQCWLSVGCARNACLFCCLRAFF
jgi:hypothetical protein